ncbi:hypothetical protein KUCAC02_019391 [Scomber scombrus]|uniref:DUF659 domain-containing protein n=1 Tax=Scomber scombrus TaxID=13677 RepID=A0AAV1PG43_SCOSC
MPLEERHTAANIMTWMEEHGWNILPAKIKAVVHDNRANMVAAMRMLEEKHGWTSVRCTWHTLQLIVNAALKEHSISRAVVDMTTQLHHVFHSWSKDCNGPYSKPALRPAQERPFSFSAGLGITERWGSLNTISTERDNPLVLAAALDPRFWKLKFVAAEDGTRVKGTVLAIKKAKETGIHGYDSVQQQKKVSVPGDKSPLDNLLQSDPESLNEEEEETQADQKIKMVRNEVQMYFAEPAISKK